MATTALDHRGSVITGDADRRGDRFVGWGHDHGAGPAHDNTKQRLSAQTCLRQQSRFVQNEKYIHYESAQMTIIL